MVRSRAVAEPTQFSCCFPYARGDPVGAAQFSHGRQAEELVAEGLFLDLTDLAEKGLAHFVFPSSLLDACTLDGRLYCVPVNILMAVDLAEQRCLCKSWRRCAEQLDEFVASADALHAAGVAPMAQDHKHGSQAV